MEMKQKYLCESWQSLLQQLQHLVGRGYIYHHVIDLPEKKKDRWEQIDWKLIGKYQSDKNKWQRSRAKVKKIANFYYLRWDRIAVLLHTKGCIPNLIQYDDKFKCLETKGKNNRIHIRISELVCFEVYLGDAKKGGVRKPAVSLEKQTFAGIKDTLEAVAATNKKTLMIKEFNKINGFPAFNSIIQQKVYLAKFLINQARRHQVNLTTADLRISTSRPYKNVYVKEAPKCTLIEEKL